MLNVVNKIFQLFIDFLVFIISILILFSLYNIISIKILNKPYTNLFCFSIFEIATGSMEPTLNVNDMVIVKITKDIKVNDIITYEEDGNLITHRVIDIKNDTITTKGDANNSLDVKVPKEKIVGKIVFVIKKGGIIRDILITPKVIIRTTIKPILISRWLAYRQDKNRKKPKKRPKNLDNKKEDNLKKNKSFQDLKNEVYNKE